MKRREQAGGIASMCIERSVGEKAGTVQGNLALETCRGIVLHELHRAAPGEEGVDGIGLRRRDLGQQRLEFHVGEGQGQLLHHLATGLFERFLEAADAFRACRLVT
jgi:hypothetical protein